MNPLTNAFIALFLIVSPLASAGTFYVSTSGKDSNTGTFSQPWLTWSHAFSTATAGDTVYFRGGVYYNMGSMNCNPPSVGHDGTASDPICYFNYPGEVPILDGINKTSPSPGLYFQNTDYVHLKGLTVRNNLQLTTNYYYASNFYFYQCNNIIFENCISYNSGHRGFDIYECHGTITFINCDSYNNCDNLTTGYAGGGGDGYQVHDNNSTDDLYTILYMTGCRAWHNSDDGFDIIFEGYAEIDSCWSFSNGYLDGEGDGFKYGWQNIVRSGVSRKVTNCLTAFNRLSAFDEGNNGYLCMNINVFNNTSYHDYAPYVTYTQCTGGVKSNVYRNNLFYRNTITDFGGAYTHSNNSWDSSPSITITDADFISIDSTGISGPRHANGSLPDLDFMKLAYGSDLINAGMPINGVHYDDSIPDLGAFQYSSTSRKPVSSITVTGVGGATTITTDKGTLQLIATVLPTDATNKKVTWSITNGSNLASINSSSGLVTAINNGSITARATANDGSGVYGSMVVTISNQTIPVTSITVTGAGGATVITTDNGTLQLSAAILPADAKNKAVTWSISSGTDKALINSTGLVTAIDNGTATARATANDGSGVYGTLLITITNQVILLTGITLTGAGGLSAITTDNGTLQLSATVLPANATNKAVTWSISSGTDKASINSTGLVTALDNGTALVRATANDGSGVYGTLTITVSNQTIPVAGITVTGAGGLTAITTDNGTLQLSATLLPANATNKAVTWSISSGTDKASISSTGLVTALDNGTAVAKATANDGSGVYGTLTITVSNQLILVTGITVTGAGGVSLISSIGGTIQLSATILPSNTTNQSVTWSISSGTDNASINSTGLVTALDYGTSVARATANDGSGVYGTLIITISNQVTPVTGITVTGAGGLTTITTNNGTLQLSAAVLPVNATNKAVTWSISSGTDKASINSTGLVTALDDGTAVARATANDGSGVYGSQVISISNQVILITSIAITGAGGTTIIATENGTLQLSAVVIPSNATNQAVTWSITNGSNLASINASTGLVTANDNGSVTARATANDGSGVYGTFIITISYILNSPPVIVVNYKSSSYSGFVNEINASGSYDSNKDNLTYSWVVPSNVPVSSMTGSTIKYLSPIVSSSQKVEFTLKISDGKTTQSRIIPIEILPYKPDLEVAEISNIEASSFQPPYYPYNIIDGNIGTMWSAEGENQWLIIELKKSFFVEHVKLAFQPGQRRESYFDILGSNDKLNWESILTKSSSCDFSGDLQVFEFPSSKAGKEFSYVKLVGLGNSIDQWNSISELKIFGYPHHNSLTYEKLAAKIYPNPAREYITIRIDDSRLLPDFIQIVNLSGTILLKEELDPNIRELEIPINLKEGTYIVMLGSGNLTLFAQKLIVSN
jgi:uncharacterized protein YjdB